MRILLSCCPSLIVKERKLQEKGGERAREGTSSCSQARVAQTISPSPVPTLF